MLCECNVGRNAEHRPQARPTITPLCNTLHTSFPSAGREADGLQGDLWAINRRQESTWPEQAGPLNLCHGKGQHRWELLPALEVIWRRKTLLLCLVIIFWDLSLIAASVACFGVITQHQQHPGTLGWVRRLLYCPGNVAVGFLLLSSIGTFLQGLNRVHISFWPACIFFYKYLKHIFKNGFIESESGKALSHLLYHEFGITLLYPSYSIPLWFRGSSLLDCPTMK